MNIQQFVQVSQMYNEIANYFLKKGGRDGSIEALRLAVRFDPGNKTAQYHLKRLLSAVRKE